MSGASHTPGPWRYDADDCRIMSSALTDWEGKPASVVDLRGAMGGDDSDADAHLIAAAPELLEALEKARLELSGIESLPRHSREDDAEVIDAMQQKAWRAMRLIDPIIAKARGEA